MSKFAADTDVPAERSRQDIEKTLARYGASAFFYASEESRAVIGFRAHERLVQFTLPLPNPKDFKWAKSGAHGNRERTAAEQRAAVEKATRQRWRCLLLAVKAKLEVVDSGIASFEQEFLAHILTKDGRTVGDHVVPRLAEQYDTGINVPLLPPPEART